MASITSHIKWIKEVEFKLDGGQITSFDLNIGNRYIIHIWQMYGPGNQWHWIIKDTGYGEVGSVGNRIFAGSDYREYHMSSKSAKQTAMKYFMYLFVIKLLRNDDLPSID